MQLDNNNGKGVHFVLVKCPKCGADLNIEADRDKAFCTYCGAEVLIHKDNEHIYSHINDAKIKQAEKSRRDKIKIGFGLLVGGLGFILLGDSLLGVVMVSFSFILLWA